MVRGDPVNRVSRPYSAASPARAFAAPRRREFGLSPGEGRRAWLEFLLAAKLHADRALRGDPAEPDDLIGLRRMATRLRAPFPVRQMTADLVGSACLTAATALSETAIADDRAEIAGFLRAGLAFLERVVRDDSHARAELSRRIAGDSDTGD